MKPRENPIMVTPMTTENTCLYNSVPSRFTVMGLLRPYIRNFAFEYDIEEYAPPHCVKTFPDDSFSPKGRHAVFFAMAGERCVGQVHIEEYWNGMARVEDIRVDEAFRRMGVGRMLMDAAVAWATKQGFPTVCLEAQDNNVAASRFYATYGFKLRGVNFGLYDSTQSRGEAALYWYLPIMQ